MLASSLVMLVTRPYTSSHSSTEVKQHWAEFEWEAARELLVLLELVFLY